MIAVDTNALVYAHRRESSFHARASACLTELVAGRVLGGQVHDARIAAICLENGVREFWTADRDFNRSPSLTVRNPLVA